MQTIYLDLDDTFVDTETYLRTVLKHELLPVITPSVYELRHTKGYSEVIEDVFQNYDSIPKKEFAEDCLNLLSTEYNVVFCSTCWNDEEEDAKRAFAESYKKNIIICRGNLSKCEVDMSEGIVIDDSLEVMCESNAKVKIQMFNPYLAKGLSYSDYIHGDYLAENLSNVVEYLLGGETKHGRSKESRGLVYKGIQTKYKNAWK